MSAARTRTVTAGESAAPPAAERVEQRLLDLGGERFFRKLPERTNRLAELIHVGAAGVAGRKVLLEAGAIRRRQPIFQILRNQLDQLAARHFREVLVVDHVVFFPPRYRSSALRTRERARCNNTR